MNLIFTWNDLKQIIRAKRKKVVGWGYFCAVVAFLYFLIVPLQYEARATFKQSSNRGDQSLDIKTLIRSFSTGGLEGSCLALMLSDTVLEKTIELLGLQVQVKSSFVKSVMKNLLAEFGVMIQDGEDVCFSSVSYSGEKPLKLVLKKTSETDFSLYDKRLRLLVEGCVGKRVSYGPFQLKLDRLPINKEITLKLLPIQSATRKLRKKLTIKPTIEDKNLLLIRCMHPDRKQSAEIVNTLMAMYEKYLIDENKIVIGAQLSYLNQRRDELSSKLDQDIQDHAKVLQSNLQTYGFLGIKDEVELLLEPLQAQKVRLDEVEIELRQMNQRIAQAALDTRLSKHQPQLIERYSKILAQQWSSAKELLSRAQKREKITDNFIEELTPAVEEFNKALEMTEVEPAFKFETLVREFMSHLQHREASLRESNQWIQAVQGELSGMSLDAARKQFNQYSTQFDALHAELKQVMFMRDHLFDPHFEIGTLSNVLGDSVTQQMIQKSSQLETQLHDTLHQSARDHQRLKATLAIHKRFLESHLEQILQLGKTRIDLIKEKLSSLYGVIKTLLLQEQETLQLKINEHKEAMHSLPELWVHENRLKFKSELTKGMMEGLVHIAESKNLAHHLYQVESRPLDKARPPLSFVRPLLAVKTALAFFLGALVLIVLIVIQALIRGFPLSLATLKELGAHTSGVLSLKSPLSLQSASDCDRETLRRVASELLNEQGSGIVAIIGEKQTLFFPALTELLKKQGKTSCVIDCSFGKILPAYDKPGLFQILNGITSQAEALCCYASYDFIPTGASSSDSVELLKSTVFSHLVLELKGHYNFIFLLSRTPLDALESEIIMDRCTHAVLVAESSLELIEPYISPSRQKEKKHVTFIQYLT
jgi:uncharacterized protein involved in exopolysaccharide biosynthesis